LSEKTEKNRTAVVRRVPRDLALTKTAGRKEGRERGYVQEVSFKRKKERKKKGHASWARNGGNISGKGTC